MDVIIYKRDTRWEGEDFKFMQIRIATTPLI